MKQKEILSAIVICLLSSLAFPAMAMAVSIEGNDRGAPQSMAPAMNQRQWDGMCDVGAVYTDNGIERFGCYAYRDNDGDGICDNAPGSAARGGFIDDDGDGICDNWECLQDKQELGLAWGYRHGSGQGRCCGRSS